MSSSSAWAELALPEPSGEPPPRPLNVTVGRPAPRLARASSDSMAQSSSKSSPWGHAELSLGWASSLLGGSADDGRLEFKEDPVRDEEPPRSVMGHLAPTAAPFVPSPLSSSQPSDSPLYDARASFSPPFQSDSFADALHASAVIADDAGALASFVLRAKRDNRDGARALLLHAAAMLGPPQQRATMPPPLQVQLSQQQQQQQYVPQQPASARLSPSAPFFEHHHYHPQQPQPQHRHQQPRGIGAILSRYGSASSAPASDLASRHALSAHSLAPSPSLSPPPPSDPEPGLAPFFANDETDARACTLVLLIPGSKSVVGHLIGKSGSWISFLERSAGVGVSVAKHAQMPAGSVERRVTITGPVARCVSAQHKLLRRVQEKLHEEGAQQELVKLVIPFAMVPHLIGKSGSSIRRLQEASLARIQIEQEPPALAGAVGRTVVVHGEPSARALAVYLVLRHLSEFKLAKEWRGGRPDAEPLQ